MTNLQDSILKKFCTPEELVMIEQKMAVLEEKRNIAKARLKRPRSINRLLRQLEKQYAYDCQKSPSTEELEQFDLFLMRNDMRGAEHFFCPEDWLYDKTLELITKNDIVYDLGAGDLRFDLMLSRKAKHIYAVEINPTILASALKVIGLAMPKNITVICGNGFNLQLPNDVTVIVCLMLHRQHPYSDEMKKRRIITATQEGIILEGSK